MLTQYSYTDYIPITVCDAAAAVAVRARPTGALGADRRPRPGTRVRRWQPTACALAGFEASTAYYSILSAQRSHAHVNAHASEYTGTVGRARSDPQDRPRLQSAHNQAIRDD